MQMRDVMFQNLAIIASEESKDSDEGDTPTDPETDAFYQQEAATPASISDYLATNSSPKRSKTLLGQKSSQESLTSAQQRILGGEGQQLQWRRGDDKQQSPSKRYPLIIMPSTVAENGLKLCSLALKEEIPTEARIERYQRRQSPFYHRRPGVADA